MQKSMTIFVPPEYLTKRSMIKVPEDKARYILSVLRKRLGDTIRVIDGKGKCYEAKISHISKKDVFIDIVSETPLNTESLLNLVLCQGILKGEKMDLVIQKATELGIKEIIPLYTERCLVKKTSKIKRWQKIAEEASEQCGRAYIPKIHEPIDIKSFLLSLNRFNGFVFWEEGGISLKDAFYKIVDLTRSLIYIIIGTEGGLTYNEVRLAEERGFIRTTLGKRILRAETAAIVSVALIQFLVEEKYEKSL